MARVRKRHVQGELFKKWGGKRRGAGRPKSGVRASEKHKRRPLLRASEPVHVTVRVANDVRSLRRRDMYKAIRWATLAVLKHDDFHIVHASIQGNHLHLIVEAQNRIALAKGMQGFLISAAKHINRTISKGRKEPRRGEVFPDRYHARILKSPRSVRHALSYVLNNWRRHGEDRGRRWKVDPFSSGIAFPGWKELETSAWLYTPPPTYEPLVTWVAKTWLLTKGWTRHGLISVHEVPGPSG
jgi:REP element-mobilizing transposase RayT